MIKYLAIPLILVGCTAPVTDPPAHACSPRLDGKPTYVHSRCWPYVPKPNQSFLPRESAQGEIDIWNPHHFIHMQSMFIRNAREMK